MSTVLKSALLVVGVPTVLLIKGLTVEHAESAPSDTVAVDARPDQ